MEKQMLVVVLGDSLLMDSVGSDLRDGLDLNVIQVNAFSADDGDWLKSLNPKLIVFELNTPRPCHILSLLREQPGTLFLGIDINCSQAIVLNSNLHSIGNMKELCQLAQTKLDYEAHTTLLQKG